MAEFEVIQFPTTPTPQQLLETVYHYSRGDQRASWHLQCLQSSPHAWESLHILFSVRTPYNNTPISSTHLCASLMAVDKVRKEWKSLKSQIPIEQQQQIKSMLQQHFVEIARDIAGVYHSPSATLNIHACANSPSVINAIIHNLATALATVAVFDHDCVALFQYAVSIQQTTPLIALALLQSLASIIHDKRVHLSQATTSHLHSFLKSHVTETLAVCEQYLLPLLPLLNKDVNPQAFSTLSAAITNIIETPSTSPQDPLAKEITIHPFHAPPNSPQVYTLQPYRSLHTYTPLVPIRTYLSLPQHTPEHYILCQNDLLCMYKYYPFTQFAQQQQQQRGNSPHNNIIFATLQCILEWIDTMPTIGQMLKIGHGVMLHIILALLPFDVYTNTIFAILRGTSTSCYPVPETHHPALILISKVCVEFSLRIQARSLYSWATNIGGLMDSSDSHSESGVIFHGVTTPSLPHAHLVRLIPNQQLPQLTKVQTVVQTASSPIPQALLMSITKHSVLFPTDPTSLVSAYGDFDTVARFYQQFTQFVVDLSSSGQNIFVAAPFPAISLTNYLMVALAHPSLAVSHVALDYFINMQSCLLEERAYCLQKPLYIYTFIIVVLQLAQRGLALYWLVNNPDIFDAIGSNGTFVHNAFYQTPSLHHGKHDETDNKSPSDPHSIYNPHDFPRGPYNGADNYTVITSQYHMLMSAIAAQNTDNNQGMFSQQFISTTSTSQLHNTPIYHINTTAEFSQNMDCGTHNSFHTLSTYLAVCTLVEQSDDDNYALQQKRYLDSIHENMYDIYSILDVSCIIFFFRALGVHLPVSAFVTRIDPNTFPVYAPPPQQQQNNRVICSTHIICNNGTPLDSITIFPYPTRVDTNCSASFLELYAYLEHLPMTNGIITRGGTIPYICHIATPALCVAYVQSTFRVLSVLGKLSAEGIFEDACYFERLSKPDAEITNILKIQQLSIVFTHLCHHLQHLPVIPALYNKITYPGQSNSTKKLNITKQQKHQYLPHCQPIAIFISQVLIAYKWVMPFLHPSITTSFLWLSLLFTAIGSTSVSSALTSILSLRSQPNCTPQWSDYSKCIAVIQEEVSPVPFASSVLSLLLDNSIDYKALYHDILSATAASPLANLSLLDEEHNTVSIPITPHTIAYIGAYAFQQMLYALTSKGNALFLDFQDGYVFCEINRPTVDAYLREAEEELCIFMHHIEQTLFYTLSLFSQNNQSILADIGLNQTLPSFSGFTHPHTNEEYQVADFQRFLPRFPALTSAAYSPSPQALQSLVNTITTPSFFTPQATEVIFTALTRLLTAFPSQLSHPISSALFAPFLESFQNTATAAHGVITSLHKLPQQNARTHMFVAFCATLLATQLSLLRPLIAHSAPMCATTDQSTIVVTLPRFGQQIIEKSRHITPLSFFQALSPILPHLAQIVLPLTANPLTNGTATSPPTPSSHIAPILNTILPFCSMAPLITTLDQIYVAPPATAEQLTGFPPVSSYLASLARMYASSHNSISDSSHSSSSSSLQPTSTVALLMRNMCGLIEAFVQQCDDQIVPQLPSLLSAVSHISSALPTTLLTDLSAAHHPSSTRIAMAKTISAQIELSWGVYDSILALLATVMLKYPYNSQYVPFITSVTNFIVDTVFIHSTCVEILSSASTPTQTQTVQPPVTTQLPLLTRELFDTTVIAAQPLLISFFNLLTDVLKIKSTSSTLTSLNISLKKNLEHVFNNTSTGYVLRSTHWLGSLFSEFTHYTFTSLFLSQSAVKNILSLAAITISTCTTTETAKLLQAAASTVAQVSKGQFHLRQWVLFYMAYFQQSLQYDPFFPQWFTAFRSTPETLDLPQLLSALASTPIHTFSTLLQQQDSNTKTSTTTVDGDIVAQLRLFSLITTAVINTLKNNVNTTTPLSSADITLHVAHIITTYSNDIHETMKHVITAITQRLCSLLLSQSQVFANFSIQELDNMIMIHTYVNSTHHIGGYISQHFNNLQSQPSSQLTTLRILSHLESCNLEHVTISILAATIQLLSRSIVQDAIALNRLASAWLAILNTVSPPLALAWVSQLSQPVHALVPVRFSQHDRDVFNKAVSHYSTGIALSLAQFMSNEPIPPPTSTPDVDLFSPKPPTLGSSSNFDADRSKINLTSKLTQFERRIKTVMTDLTTAFNTPTATTLESIADNLQKF